MLYGPLLQTIFFFLLVDDLPNIFLHEFAFWNIFECCKSPTFSYFSFGLALDELTFGHSPIATVLATEITICTRAFVICDAIETIRPTEGTCAFAFLLLLALLPRCTALHSVSAVATAIEEYLYKGFHSLTTEVKYSVVQYDLQV